ncbi:MAG: HNH endonuclease [Acidimicrobiia bacterium]
MHATTDFALPEMTAVMRTVAEQWCPDTPPNGDDIAALYAHLRATQYAIARAVTVADQTGVWDIAGAASPVTWLAHHGRLTRSAAAREVRNARKTDRHESIAAALASDAITLEQVGELARLERHRSQRFTHDVAVLTEHARRCDPDSFRVVARHWRILADDLLTPDERDEPNSLDLAQGVGGTWLLRATFDTTRGAVLANALLERSAPSDGDDYRTASERRADAFFELLTGNQPIVPRVDVVVDLNTFINTPASLDAMRCELHGAGTVNRLLLEQLACTPEIRRVLTVGGSEILDLGQTVRLATPAQRRAIRIRDRGCVWPDCKRPSAMCEIHHIIPWQGGGPTDLSNLAMLCNAHHRRIHKGWKLVHLADGSWDASPP